jgi:hypothetical protein
MEQSGEDPWKNQARILGRIRRGSLEGSARIHGRILERICEDPWNGLQKFLEWSARILGMICEDHSTSEVPRAGFC